MKRIIAFVLFAAVLAWPQTVSDKITAVAHMIDLRTRQMHEYQEMTSELLDHFRVTKDLEGVLIVKRHVDSVTKLEEKLQLQARQVR